MNESMEKILLEALDLMEQGASIDEIVTRYPDQTAELRSFLMTATALSNLANQPALTAQAQSKRALLAAADQATVARSRPAAASGGWLRRLAMPLVAVLVALFLGGAGLVSASGSAVPGDALYETKRLVEEVRINLTTNPEFAAELREQFRVERIHEIEKLLAGGRVAEVSLAGALESINGDRWLVAGVPVIVTDRTVIDGAPVEGAFIQVDGRTGEAGVMADRVMILSAPALPEPTPNPDAAVTMPAPRPRATMPVVDDNDNSDDGSDDVTPGSQMPPGSGVPASPTASPTTAPVSTPTPTATSAANDNDDDNANDNADDDDNANDNGDDNANDNADDNADDNANDNADDNANDNADDNANDNADDNANDNADDNANDNADDNANDNADDNADDNANDNADDNANDNANDNADDNANDNADDNTNDNADDNTNDNADDNSDNDNAGGGEDNRDD